MTAALKLLKVRAISSAQKKRRTGKRSAPVKRQPRRVWAWMLLVLYSAAVMYWMFIGFGRAVHSGGPLQYNVEPLKTIKLYFDLDNGVSFTGRLINLLGNVAVFIPFGLLLPLLKRRFDSIIGLTLCMAPCILLLESLQMLLRVGSFDIDDLLLNLLGVWTGYIVLHLAWGSSLQ